MIGRRGGEWLGGPLRPLLTADLDFLLGARRLLGWVLLNFSTALMGTLFIAVAFVGFRLLLRRTSGAVAASVVLLAAMMAPRTGWSRPEDLPAALAISGVVIFVLLRFGFLATVVMSFLVSGGQLRIPFTMDLGASYGQATLALVHPDLRDRHLRVRGLAAGPRLHARSPRRLGGRRLVL